MADFQTLKKRYGLNNGDFFLDFSFLSDLLLIVFTSAYTSDTGMKVISNLYQALQDIKKENTFYIKHKWENETKKTIPDEVWTSYCTFQWKISSSGTYRMFSWKMLSRYFFSPAQSSHQLGPPSCWRKCGSQLAHHYHLFWTCPLIVTFWQKIHVEIEIILQEKIPLNWDEFLFGLVHSIPSNLKTKQLFGILTVAAKKAITRKWLKADIPSLDNWYDKIHEIYIMERITFSMRLQENTFEEIWKKWRIYISQRRPSLV